MTDLAAALDSALMSPLDLAKSMFLPQTRDQSNRLDWQVRSKLAGSLRYISEHERFKTEVGEVNVAGMLDEIIAHRQPPGVFARYFELVFALRGKRYQNAASLFREIAVLARNTPTLDVKPMTEEAMGADAARYARLLNANERGTLIGAPDLAYWNGLDARVAIALDTLTETDAALAEEVRALIYEVVAAMPADPSGQFGAISSLTLWGTVVLRLDHHRTALEIMESLVHEGAHILLFGYAAEQPLVTDALSERFESPLRKDPRPMDGVFHATFVCARLHLLYRKLSEKPVLAAQISDTALRQRSNELASKFDDGAQVVAKYARLTDVGETVMRDATHYMSDAAV